MPESHYRSQAPQQQQQEEEEQNQQQRQEEEQKLLRQQQQQQQQQQVQQEQEQQQQEQVQEQKQPERQVQQQEQAQVQIPDTVSPENRGNCLQLAGMGFTDMELTDHLLSNTNGNLNLVWVCITQACNCCIHLQIRSSIGSSNMITCSQSGDHDIVRRM